MKHCFFFQAEDGIRDYKVTGVQTCALPIYVNYNEFFLAGILAMASFAIASNTSWSFFLDRDNGIFYEMLTYPMSRSEYLLGKVIFNVLISIGQADRKSTRLNSSHLVISYAVFCS